MYFHMDESHKDDFKKKVSCKIYIYVRCHLDKVKKMEYYLEIEHL